MKALKSGKCLTTGTGNEYLLPQMSIWKKSLSLNDFNQTLVGAFIGLLESIRVASSVPLGLDLKWTTAVNDHFLNGVTFDLPLPQSFLSHTHCYKFARRASMRKHYRCLSPPCFETWYLHQQQLYFMKCLDRSNTFTSSNSHEMKAENLMTCSTAKSSPRMLS